MMQHKPEFALDLIQVAEAIGLEVPAPGITLLLMARLPSHDAESFSDRLLSAVRNQFGGHEIRKE